MWSTLKRSVLAQYLIILLSVLILLYAQLNVKLIANGLHAAIYFVIITAASLLADFSAGLVAIVLCTLAVGYLSYPAGFSFSQMPAFRMLEFLLVSITIFWLSWRSRSLFVDNKNLLKAIGRLKAITTELKTESKGNKKTIKKLNIVNSELTDLVHNFLQDDDYWNRKSYGSGILPKRPTKPAR